MKHLTLTMLICFVFVLLFLCFPEIDIFASSLFYDKDLGAFRNRSHHLIHSNYFWLFLDYGAVYIIPTVCALLCIGLSIKIFIKNRSTNYKNYIAVLYLMTTAILGPGVVATLTKDYIFCRARPEAIEEFGGAKSFTPAFVMSDQCQKNCSFISGHASSAFFLFGIAFWINNRKPRQLMIIFVISLGIAVSVGRISFGRHFLSDVLFAGFFMYIVSYGVAALFKLPSVSHNVAKRD